jgi:hypothetical protein
MAVLLIDTCGSISFISVWPASAHLQPVIVESRQAQERTSMVLDILDDSFSKA